MGREKRQAKAKMDKRYQGLVKQNSGRVFTVDDGQAAMEIVGTRGDFRPSAMRRKTSKHDSSLLC